VFVPVEAIRFVAFSETIISDDLEQAFSLNVCLLILLDA